MAVALAVDPMELSEPPPMLGRYAVLDHIAEGGMASIFRGQDTVTGELVALKTVRTATAREIAGLEREIKILRGFKHPGVLRFVSAGQWDGKPWMAVELLEGLTLFGEIASMWRDRPWESGPRIRSSQADAEPLTMETGWVRRLEAEPALAGPQRRAAGGRLREALSLVVTLARVLAYVHGRGVVHRDLKPENVFLGQDGRMTLLDFGLSCRTGSRALEGEEKRSRIATVEYAAPELLYGDRVDARADIYSLGCILYEVTTGVRPFDGESTEGIVRMHLDREPTCPSDRVSGISRRMEDLILEMLAKKPKHRPRSAGFIADQLTEAYHDSVASEARPSVQ